MRFLTSNTALAIPWMLSLSVLLAFIVPWLGTGREFFFVSDFQKEPRPQAVAYPGGVLRVLEHPPKAQECN